VTAIELLRRNKAPRLLIGGGGSPQKGYEADAVKTWIAHWQLSTAEVISLGKCLDTHDEAEESRRPSAPTRLETPPARHLRLAHETRAGRVPKILRHRNRPGALRL